MTDRLKNTVIELRAAEDAARKGDLYNAGRDFDIAGAELLANQKPGTTISAWTARNRDKGARWACAFCGLLTLLFNLSPLAKKTRDHCDDALKP